VVYRENDFSLHSHLATQILSHPYSLLTNHHHHSTSLLISMVNPLNITHPLGRPSCTQSSSQYHFMLNSTITCYTTQRDSLTGCSVPHRSAYLHFAGCETLPSKNHPIPKHTPSRLMHNFSPFLPPLKPITLC
jgi:hypothetical protein